MKRKKPEIEEHFIELEPYMQCLLNARQILATARGSFYPDKNFGSQLSLLTKPMTGYALAYAAQALAQSDGYEIKQAEAQRTSLVLSVCINDEEGMVIYRID